MNDNPKEEAVRLLALSTEQSIRSAVAHEMVVDSKFTDIAAAENALKSAVMATEARKAAANLLAESK